MMAKTEMLDRLFDCKLIDTSYLWSLRFMGFGLVLVFENKMAKFYGKSQGRTVELSWRKNTIYMR
jgi:hypothetical protein